MISEFYDLIGSDYKALLKRLDNKEDRLISYLKMYCNDKTFKNAQEAMRDNSYEDMYIYIHSIKGVSANLDIDIIVEVCESVLKAIKVDNKEDIKQSFEIFEAKYIETTESLKKFL